MGHLVTPVETLKVKLRGALFAMILVLVFNFVADFKIVAKVKRIKKTLQDFEVKL